MSDQVFTTFTPLIKETIINILPDHIISTFATGKDVVVLFDTENGTLAIINPDTEEEFRELNLLAKMAEGYRPVTEDNFLDFITTKLSPEKETEYARPLWAEYTEASKGFIFDDYENLLPHSEQYYSTLKEIYEDLKHVVPCIFIYGKLLVELSENEI
jgi:hypothetical protein